VTLLSDPLFYLVAVPAVILTGLSKGGFAGLGVMAVPVLALRISPVQAAAIMLPILCVQDMFGVWAYRHQVAWKVLAPMIPGALIGIAIAYFLAASVSVPAVELAVGLVSLWGAASRIIRKAALQAARKPDTLLGFLSGAGMGFTSTISHAGTPPYQLYVVPLKLPRDLLAGTTTVAFAIVNAVKLLPYSLLGQFSHENLVISAALFPLAIFTTYAGIWLVRRVDPERFYVFMDIMLAVVGAKLLFDGIRGLI
jgi:uncharacterized membrane protein YfcA